MIVKLSFNTFRFNKLFFPEFSLNVYSYARCTKRTAIGLQLSENCLQKLSVEITEHYPGNTHFKFHQNQFDSFRGSGSSC